jgi:hypothetical protein
MMIKLTRRVHSLEVPIVVNSDYVVRLYESSEYGGRNPFTALWLLGNDDNPVHIAEPMDRVMKLLNGGK